MLSHLYPPDFNLWRWLSDNKKTFIATEIRFSLHFLRGGVSPYHAQPHGKEADFVQGRSRRIKKAWARAFVKGSMEMQG